MKTLLELREELAAKTAAQESLVTAAEQAARNFSDEERSRFDALQNEIETLSEDIRRAEIIERNRKDKAAAATKSPEEKLQERFSMGRAVQSLAKGNRLEGAEAEMHQEAEREAREAGVSVAGVALPSWMIRFDAEKRTDWNVTTPADGGSTVQTNVQGLVEPLRPVSVLSQMGITVRSGLRGNLSFQTDTAGSGAWEGETDANANYSPAIGTVSSSPKRFGAVATLSKQLLAQSQDVMDAYVRRQLELTIGTAIDVTGIQGGGANQPTGIIGNASVPVLSAGLASATGVNADGAALVWGDLTKMWGAVTAANANMQRRYFLTTPGVFEKGSRTPRQSSGVEGNFIFNEAMRVYGHDVKLSTNVPSNLEKGSSGATLHAIVYGEFTELALHQWGGVDLVINPYTLAKSAQLEIVANVWVDWCITRPTSFVVIKDLVV